jgi:hypothetical protein
MNYLVPFLEENNMRGLSGVIYGREGMGKTSLGLRFPGPVHCKSILESGYDDLEMVGGVPENSTNVRIKTFEQLVDETKKVQSGTLLIDSSKGLQSKIFDYVCQTYYKNDRVAFNSYSAGARRESPAVLQDYLDLCSYKTDQGINVIFIGHVGTISLPNTMGPDYLCHVINLDDGEKGLGMRTTLTAWAGFIFFLNLSVDITRVTEADRSTRLAMEGKAKEFSERILYTTSSTAHQAKNRWNMPPVIPMGKNPEEAWNNLFKALPEGYRKEVTKSAGV